METANPATAGWYMIETIGAGGKQPLSFASRNDVLFAFTSLERISEFVAERKPAGASVTPDSFRPLSQSKFTEFLETAYSEPHRKRYFIIDPSPYFHEPIDEHAIAKFLRNEALGISVAL